MAEKTSHLDAAMRACRDARVFSKDFLGWSMTPRQVAAMIEAALKDEFVRDAKGARIRAKYLLDQNKKLILQQIMKERNETS